MVDLKPCPFCGGRRVDFAHNIEMEPDGIICFNCHIVVRYPRDHVKGGERFEAVMSRMAKIWNTREGKTNE